MSSENSPQYFVPQNVVRKLPFMAHQLEYASKTLEDSRSSGGYNFPNPHLAIASEQLKESSIVYKKFHRTLNSGGTIEVLPDECLENGNISTVIFQFGEIGDSDFFDYVEEVEGDTTPFLRILEVQDSNGNQVAYDTLLKDLEIRHSIVLSAAKEDSVLTPSSPVDDLPQRPLHFDQ